MRQLFQVFASIQFNVLLRQYFTGRDQFKVWMRLQKSFRDCLIFIAQQATGCVDNPATGLTQLRRTRQDIGLLYIQICKIRVAAQSPQAATWRIHQHAVKLAVQAFEFQIIFVIDQLRLQVG
jgi:hypothetical protein